MTNPYRKSVRHLDEIDIYQIGNLYEVKSHAVFHALKKLLCAGKRGAKDYEQDLMEAIESIERELQIVGLAEASAPGGTQDCGFRPTVHVGLPMDPEPDWDQRHPDLRFAVRGENGQFVYCKDAPSSGEFWARPVDTEFDEQRIDVIGQNGNEGEHYDAPESWRVWGYDSGPHMHTLSGEAIVEVRMRNGKTGKGPVKDWNWYVHGEDLDIMAYRLA